MPELMFAQRIMGYYNKENAEVIPLFERLDISNNIAWEYIYNNVYTNIRMLIQDLNNMLLTVDIRGWEI